MWAFGAGNRRRSETLQKGGAPMTTRLKRAREASGLSLRAAQEIHGIVASRACRHENREEKLWPRDVERYANAFGVDDPESLRDESGFATEAAEEE